jgi:hypothetical protein
MDDLDKLWNCRTSSARLPPAVPKVFEKFNFNAVRWIFGSHTVGREPALNE